MRAAPAGYEGLAVGRAEAVAVPDVTPLLREVLATGTLYDFARVHRDARALAGRQPAYAVPAPGAAGHMVVRHNRHGGLFAALTGDRFLYPTRAPHELAISTRLTAAGVPTPEILAYVIYRAGPFATSDVATRLVAPSRDLSAVLAANDAPARSAALDMAATLVARLSRAGARHHDLNAKNVLVGDVAYVLDVDRVKFGWTPEDALAHNLARLDRSLRKRRERFGEMIADDEIALLARRAAQRM
ncbi:MAG: hypothetical protein KGL93_11660 [Gemmatimonadota bacterium]|nr:hypothetical protein [Gemmatimonadota bacterium]